jgi:SAM-dependent methyltransferase
MSSFARSCPVCGSTDDTHVYAPENFDQAKFNAYSFASRKQPEFMHARLIECPGCDLVYANPLLELGSLETAYQEAAFDSGREAAFAAETYGRLLPEIMKKLPDCESALDIGTGDGAFLSTLLQYGFKNVVGVEPSKAPIQAAAPEIRALIREEMFRPESFAPGSLSLITCFQTIEHLSDPAAICRQALGLLKPGGALLLVGHNRRAMSAKVLGRKSPIFDIEHLQLFSPASMQRLLEVSGYEQIHARSIVNRYPLSYWMRLFPFPQFIKNPLIRFMNAIYLGKLPIPLPVGNLATVGYKPR